MKEGYDMAYWSFKSGNHTRVTMQNLFKTMMAKQESYNVSLANNRDFRNWAQTDGWGEGWMFIEGDVGGPTPVWDPDLAELWSEEFTSIDQLRQAFVALFYWRYWNGMEPEAMVWRRNLLSLMPFPDPSYFEGCSMHSKSLSAIYQEYYWRDAGNFDLDNFEPLARRIIEWMDDTYGFKF